MKKIPFQRSLPKGVFTLLCAVACIAGALTSHAADSSWNVDAAGNWSTAGSWTAGVPGSTSILTSADIATFSNTLTAARTVTVDANRNIGGITFGNTSNFGFTLSSGNLLLTNGGVIQNLSGTGNHTNTISSPITIQGNGGSATFTANATSGTSLLSIANVSGVSTTGNTTTVTLNGSNTGANSLQVVRDGTAGGRLALVKDGTGLWTIGLANNLNTFTGGVTLNQGTLRLITSAGGQSLGSAGAVTMANVSGTTLDLNNNSVTIGSLSGGGTTGGNITTGGTSGTLALGLSGASTSYAGVISGTGGLRKLGAGTQSLANANTYSGGTRVSGGTLNLDFSAATAPASNITASTSVLTLDGGRLTLTGKANTTNSQTFASTTLGTSTASGGSAASSIVLNADATANPLLLNLGAITRNAGTTLDITLPTGTQSTTNGVRTSTTNVSNNVFTTSTNIAYATIGGTTWAGRTGAGTQNLVAFTDAGGSYSTGNANYTSTRNVDVTNGDTPSADFTVNTLRFNGGTKVLTLADSVNGNVVSTGGILVTSGTTATITGGTLRSSATADALQLINFGTQLTVDSIIANNGTDPTVLTLAGPGSTTLNGANTYTGGTHITGGTVKVGHAQALGTSAAVSLADNSNAILDLNGFDLTIGSLAGGGGQGTLGQVTFGTSGGTVALGSRTLTVGNTSDTVFGGTITGTGGSLIKVGSGQLLLHGANTFTGGVVIRAGTLSAAGVTGNNAFGSGTITLGDSAGGSANATLRVGTTLGVSGLYVYNNPIVLAANTTGILNVTTNSANGTYELTGGVTGNNNFSINPSNGGGLIFSTNAINNSGTLLVSNATNFLGITISGGIGSNVTDVSLVNNNTGSITISTLGVNNRGAITHTGTSTGTATISAVIGNSITGITQNSATSAMTLSGANTFSAPIQILAGTLTAGGGATVTSLGINAPITIANESTATLALGNQIRVIGSIAGGGTTGGNIATGGTSGGLIVGGNHTSTTYAGIISGAGASTGTIRKVGSGTLTLTGANSYTGATIASGGTLEFDYVTADPFISSGAITLAGGTLSFKGKSDGSTTDTTGTINISAPSRNGITVQNNATITTSFGTVTNVNPLLLDVSGSGTLKTSAALTTTGSISNVALVGGIVQLGTRANFYVKDASGIGFATQDGSNNIVRYTSATTLDAGTATTNTTNYRLSADLTRTAALNFQTLELNTSSAAVTLSMGTRALTPNGNGRSILVTGNNDATITSTTGVVTSGTSYNIANYGTGTTTIDMSNSGVAIVKSGPGLVVYSKSNNPADVYVTEGTLRFNQAMTYNTNALRIYGGGIFEIGADLETGNAGDLTRAVGTSANNVSILGDGGFSAHGADRVVALGGVASPTALTWGASNFLTYSSGTADYDAIFKLGSATSTHTLEFANAIDLGNRQRFIDVANGTSSTNVDGRLTGVMSGTGGLTKTGAGTLALTGLNTYSGTTNVTSGALQVGSAGVGRTGTGAVAAQTGSTILGSGVVQGSSFTATSGSTVHAGDGTAQSNYGTLTFTPASGSGRFDFQSGSSVVLGLNPGGTGDLLSFDGLSNGTLLFNGNLSVTAPGYNPVGVDTFNLLDWANLSTTTFHSRFSSASYSGFLLGNGDDNLGFDLPDISSSGYGWDISQFTVNGTISTVFIIPEPSRALLLMLGLLGIVTRRRRK
jgi:autotransporter-associated beta strand protein